MLPVIKPVIKPVAAPTVATPVLLNVNVQAVVTLSLSSFNTLNWYVPPVVIKTDVEPLIVISVVASTGAVVSYLAFTTLPF